MKIKLQQSALHSALSRLQGAVGSANCSVEALACIKVEAAAGPVGIVLTATNLDITRSVTVECAVEDVDGPCVVPYHTLARIVGGLDGGELTITTCPHMAADGFKVVSTRAKYAFATLDLDRLPNPAKESESDEIVSAVGAKDLRDIIQWTKFAAEKANGARSALKSLLLCVSADETLGVATNGRVMAVAKKAGSQTSEGFEMLIPQAAASELAKFIGELVSAKALDVAMPRDPAKRNYVEFAADGATLRMKLCSEQYPNWRRVLPQAEQARCKVSASEMCATLRRLSLFASAYELETTKCTFNAQGIRMESNGDMTGQAMETVGAEGYECTPMTLHFNPALLLDAVSSPQADEVTLALHGSGPLKITARDGSYMALVMPCRVA